jgi:hypothetical protein
MQSGRALAASGAFLAPIERVQWRHRVSLMYLQPGASRAKYQGRNELLWEHQGKALVRWGRGALEMRCVKTMQRTQ